MVLKKPARSQKNTNTDVVSDKDLQHQGQGREPSTTPKQEVNSGLTEINTGNDYQTTVENQRQNSVTKRITVQSTVYQPRPTATGMLVRK